MSELIDGGTKKVSAEEFYQHLHDAAYNMLVMNGIKHDVALWFANLAVRVEKLERFES